MSGATPAGEGDHTEPTMHGLADLADELGDPLDHSLVLLEMIRDSEIGNERNVANVAAGVMALIEQANQRRERLMEHLARLAKSERAPEEPEAPRAASSP